MITIFCKTKYKNRERTTEYSKTGGNLEESSEAQIIVSKPTEQQKPTEIITKPNIITRVLDRSLSMLILSKDD